MQRPYVSLIILLIACGNTSTGIQLEKTNSKNWGPDSVKEALDITLRVFKSRVFGDPRFKDPVMEGWDLQVSDWDIIQRSDGRLTIGLCFCDYKKIIITNLPYNESAFSHEIAHAIQDCDPIHSTEYNDNADPEHENWNAVGINRALTDIKQGLY